MNFYDKLQELKYPKLASFSPTSFDWLFDNEESLEFLTWFCKSVDYKNLVSEEELDRLEFLLIVLNNPELRIFLRFNFLKKEGKVLEGRHLKEALENYCGLEESIPDIEESIKQLEQKKKYLLEQKDIYTNSIQHYRYIPLLCNT